MTSCEVPILVNCFVNKRVLRCEKSVVGVNYFKKEITKMPEKAVLCFVRVGKLLKLAIRCILVKNTFIAYI